MPEYIEREALISELQEEIEFETSMYTEEQNKYFNMGLKCAIRDVKSQPAADVTEVRRGKWLTWEEQFPDRKPTKKNSLGVFCNNCHSHADNMTNYCPNCGAKMDGATDTNVGGKLKEGAEE